jgi:hypothetical protein
MELISPINVRTCKPYIGKPVCAVLHDGSHVYGYLHKVDGGKLYFAETAQGPGTVSTRAEKAKKPLNKKMDKAQTSFFSPFFSPGFFALDLALIALLFAVPFIW